tara:strand:- start:74 stop:289 length:216 start_codon:yes stop_codon:yes gene_type:complete
MIKSYKPIQLYSENSEATLETCLNLVEEGLLEYYSLTETYTLDEMMDTQYAFEAIESFILKAINCGICTAE